MHLIDIWLQGMHVSDDLHIQPCHLREIHPEGKKTKPQAHLYSVIFNSHVCLFTTPVAENLKLLENGSSQTSFTNSVK